MVDNFPSFAKAVQKRFNELAQDQLYVVNSNNDLIWQTYLGAFPEGSNPIFRERTHHDCSCCRHFIRDIGNVVGIQNGVLASIWDLNGLPYPYQIVADKMSAYVKSLEIRDVFLTPFAKHGQAFSHELINGQTHRWNHFVVEVPKKYVTASYVKMCGEIRTTAGVFWRGLTELKPEALATVLELIQENALYRGQEFKKAIEEFQQMQSRIIGNPNSRILIWSQVNNSAARFRNTVIGTLVQDISEGVDVETAVKSYETKVAPQNYKRPTALITKKMVDAAMKTIQDLGLEQSLERRHARLSDVSVNSVLFVDNAVQGEMKGGIRGLLMEEVKPATFNPKEVEEISIDKFVGQVLPKSTGLKLYLENSLLANFVSLTAPKHDEAKHLFKWNNNFAWSYDGNVTDSIKAKVKRAGGKVEDVALRISLAWFNTDDLDIHVIEPDKNHIFYANKSNKLDVDMNVRGETREPVENVRWIQLPKDGVYDVFVNNFRKRESIDVGFVVEIESAFGLESFRFEQAVPNGKNKPVAKITIKNRIVTIKSATGIIAGSISQEKWGLKTLDLVRVNSLVVSPNHWDDNRVGNKHWFFILEGCKNPEPTRGIYNEFLNSNLETHRKVFEVLGEKTKCPVVPDQLSGIGFSLTRKDKVVIVASGPSVNRAYRINFSAKEISE